MPITRKQKEDIVDKLKDKLLSSKFIVFLNFHGLSVAKASEFRRLLRNAGAKYTVAKKTLLGMAAKKSRLEISYEKLVGEVAVVTGATNENEMLSVSKEIFVFAKKNKNIFNVLGGFRTLRDESVASENKVWIDAEEIKKFSIISSREVLLTQLAFILNQPMAGLTRALSSINGKNNQK